MQKTILRSYIFIALFAITMIVWAIPNYTPESLGYGLPPAVLPYCLSFVLLFLSLYRIILSFREIKADIESSISVWGLLHLLKFVVLFFATFPLMSLIGFIPASIIVIALLQILAGQRKVAIIASVSIVVSLIFYCIIVYVVNAPLP